MADIEKNNDTEDKPVQESNESSQNDSEQGKLAQPDVTSETRNNRSWTIIVASIVGFAVSILLVLYSFDILHQVFLYSGDGGMTTPSVVYLCWYLSGFIALFSVGLLVFHRKKKFHKTSRKLSKAFLVIVIVPTLLFGIIFCIRTVNDWRGQLITKKVTLETLGLNSGDIPNGFSVESIYGHPDFDNNRNQMEPCHWFQMTDESILIRDKKTNLLVDIQVSVTIPAWWALLQIGQIRGESLKQLQNTVENYKTIISNNGDKGIQTITGNGDKVILIDSVDIDENGDISDFALISNQPKNFDGAEMYGDRVFYDRKDGIWSEFVDD